MSWLRRVEEGRRELEREGGRTVWAWTLRKIVQSVLYFGKYKMLL